MHAERTTTDRKLLDLEAHIDGNSYDFRSLARDVAAAAIEVDKTKPIENRVWRVRLYLINEDLVLNWPNKRKRVQDQYNVKNEFNSRETTAGLAIIDFLKDGKVGEMFAWISPPTEKVKYYQEARLQVGVIKKKMGLKFVEYYGIPLKTDPQTCLNLFYWLQKLSIDNAQKPANPEGLRSIIIKKIRYSKENGHWTDFWQEVLPELSVVWEMIKNGEVGRNTRKVLAESTKSVKSQTPTIKRAVATMRTRDFIYAGAGVERQMARSDHNIISDLCGITNSDLLRQSSTYFVLSVSTSENGEVVTKVKEIVKCVNCPSCHQTVDAEISDGEIRCLNCGAKKPYHRIAAAA